MFEYYMIKIKRLRSCGPTDIKMKTLQVVKLHRITYITKPSSTYIKSNEQQNVNCKHKAVESIEDEAIQTTEADGKKKKTDIL